MDINENTKKILELEINKAHDMYKRHASESSVGIIYHEKDIDEELFESFFRKNDKVVKLDKNHYFVMFLFTPEREAYEAAKNLLARLDKYFHDTTSCIALDSACKNDSVNMIINKLLQILKETKKNSISRIEYEDILDELF